MNYPKPIVKLKEPWLKEIKEAYLDAKETIAFSSSTGLEMLEKDLFNLAPLVCLKFRGIKDSKENKKKATEAALSSYIANEELNAGILKNPIMAFSFCYILAHYGLGLLNDEECQDILIYVEDNLEKI